MSCGGCGDADSNNNDNNNSKLTQAQRDGYTLLVAFLVALVVVVWLLGAATPISSIPKQFSIVDKK